MPLMSTGAIPFDLPAAHHTDACFKKIQGVLEKKQRPCRTTEAKHMAIGKVQSILTYVQPLPWPENPAPAQTAPFYQGIGS